MGKTTKRGATKAASQTGNYETTQNRKGGKPDSRAVLQPGSRETRSTLSDLNSPGRMFYQGRLPS